MRSPGKTPKHIKLDECNHVDPVATHRTKVAEVRQRVRAPRAQITTTRCEQNRKTGIILPKHKDYFVSYIVVDTPPLII